ncbi:MAG: hypothetical protein ABIN36_09740 [Ferruginibacter sp.]
MTKTIIIASGEKVVLKADRNKTSAQFANGYKPSRSSISRRTSSMRFSQGNKINYVDLHSLFFKSVSGNTLSAPNGTDFNSSLTGTFATNATILFQFSRAKEKSPSFPI